jgi:hypothetical protein
MTITIYQDNICIVKDIKQQIMCSELINCEKASLKHVCYYSYKFEFHSNKRVLVSCMRLTI